MASRRTGKTRHSRLPSVVCLFMAVKMINGQEMMDGKKNPIMILCSSTLLTSARYPRNLRMNQAYRLEKTRAWQCAAALWTYANKGWHCIHSRSLESEINAVFIECPPAFSHVQNHDTEGIQYVFLRWAFLECMRWYPSLGDVIFHQKYGRVPHIFRTA